MREAKLPNGKIIKLYDRVEAAKMIGINPMTLDKLVKAGKLAGRKLGRSWAFTEEAITAYLCPQPGEGDQPLRRGKRGEKGALPTIIQ